MPDSLADARGRRSRKNARTPATYQGTDACGIAPRKNPRSALPGVEADACGIAPRKTPRSALPGVEADACGTAPRMNPRAQATYQGTDARGPGPRKTPRPVGRGRRPRGRRPNRRRSLSHVRPSLPRLSPDSPGIDGEIALLRSLTNRLLSTRPLDYTQVNRCLRLIIRAYSAQAKAPKQLTDEEQIDNLIKKVFQDNIDKGDLDFRDLVPVRMARPGDKWWPWRMLLPLRDRWRYGLIDPDEPWPHEENEKLAEIEAMQKFIAEAYNNPDFFNDLEDDDDDDSNDEDYLSEDDDSDDEDEDDDPDDDPGGGVGFPSSVGVPLVGTLTATHADTAPSPDWESILRGRAGSPSPVGVPLVGILTATHADTGPSPDWADPNPPPRIARGRPPP